MRKGILFIIAGIALIFLNACATTEHGAARKENPEIIIQGRVGEQAKGEIINFMLDWEYNLKSSETNLLVFERPNDSFMGDLMFTTGYGGKPNRRTTFTIVETAESTRIIVRFAIVSNPNSSFEKINSFGISDKVFYEYQNELEKIKTNIEGTTSSN